MDSTPLVTFPRSSNIPIMTVVSMSHTRLSSAALSTKRGEGSEDGIMGTLSVRSARLIRVQESALLARHTPALTTNTLTIATSKTTTKPTMKMETWSINKLFASVLEPTITTRR